MANLFRRGEVYWIGAREGGQRVRWSLHTADESMAKIALGDYERRRAAGVFGVQLKKTVAERIEDRLAASAAYCKKSTQVSHGIRYRRIGEFFAAGITQRRIDEFVKMRLDSGAAVGTVRNDLIDLNTICCEADNVTVRIPSEVGTEKRIYLTEEEIPRLLARLDEDRREHVTALLLTGCRREELPSIPRSGWTDFKGCVQIPNIKNRRDKPASWRPVPIHPKLLPIVERRLDREYPFAHGHGEHWLNRALGLAAAWERIDLDVTCKLMRSTFCSLLVQKGVPLLVVSKLAGHSSVAVTARYYARFAPGNMAEGVSKLEW